MRNDPPTVLLQALRLLSTEEQHEFASLAGTTRNYLYQLATCQRRSPSSAKAVAISEAATRMHVRTLGRVPKLTVEQLAKMCPIDT